MVEFLGVRIKSLKLKDHPVLGDLEQILFDALEHLLELNHE